MTQAECIQSFREQHHLSRNQLAYYTGCSANLVARLENGAEPSPEWWNAFQNMYRGFDTNLPYQEEMEDVRMEIEYLMEHQDQQADDGNTAQGEREPKEAESPSERIHAARKRYGLTSGDLADLLGISRSRVSQIEHGKISEASADHILDVMENYMAHIEERMPG